MVWSRDPWNAWEVHVEVGGGYTWSRAPSVAGWGYVEVWDSIRES